jgi:hypothetical protein
MTSERQSIGFLRAIWPLALLLFVASGASLLFLFHNIQSVFPFDDSYITLTYAHNVATYMTFAFDPELPTSGLGATSPLHVFLLASVIFILDALSFSDEIAIALALGIAAHVGLAWSTYWLGLIVFVDRWIALLGAVLTSITGYLIYDSLNGLETTLFLILNVVALAHLLRDTQGKRPLVTGLLLTLVIIARPEGVFLLIAVMLFEGWRRRVSQAPLWPYMGLLLLPAVLGGLIYGIYSWAYIGTPLPGTGLAKLLYFREYLLPFSTKLLFASYGLYAFHKPIFLFLLLTFIAIVTMGRPRSRLVILIVMYLVIFYLVYLMLFPGGLTFYWSRYQHFVLPFMMLYAATGILFLARRIFRLAVVSRLLVLGVCALLLISAVVSHYSYMRARFQEDLQYTSNTGLALASWVRANTPPGAVIATHDIGVLGYYSERRVFDLVGLVNREVLRHHLDKSVKSYLLERQVDYLVIFPLHDELFLDIRPDEDPATFEFIGEFGPIRGGHTFAVYKIIGDYPTHSNR